MNRAVAFPSPVYTKTVFGHMLMCCLAVHLERYNSKYGTELFSWSLAYIRAIQYLSGHEGLRGLQTAFDGSMGRMMLEQTWPTQMK